MLRSRFSPLLNKSATRLLFRQVPSPIGLSAIFVQSVPKRPLISRAPVSSSHAIQFSRAFTSSAVSKQTDKAAIHPTPVPIGDMAKRDDHKEHSGATELQTDIKKVSEMFGGTPAPALLAGMVGVVPYAIASVATLFLTWDINAATHQAHTLKGMTASSAYYLDPQTAQHWLDVLQPLQIGYGAVLLSFLGAIHWGLEFAGMGGHLGFRRYFLGILAPTLAWPTILLPTNFALVIQFLGFTGMYWADSSATRYGWAPPWYNGYRFVLTFIVCTSIVFNLIVKEYITYTESTHGKLENLKTQRKNTKGVEVDAKKKTSKHSGKKTKAKKKKSEDEEEDEE